MAEPPGARRGPGFRGAQGLRELGAGAAAGDAAGAGRPGDLAGDRPRTGGDRLARGGRRRANRRRGWPRAIRPCARRSSRRLCASGATTPPRPPWPDSAPPRSGSWPTTAWRVALATAQGRELDIERELAALIAVEPGNLDARFTYEARRLWNADPAGAAAARAALADLQREPSVRIRATIELLAEAARQRTARGWAPCSGVRSHCSPRGRSPIFAPPSLPAGIRSWPACRPRPPRGRPPTPPCWGAGSPTSDGGPRRWPGSSPLRPRCARRRPWRTSARN